jgi:phosphohistidine swiveling domain-containing protein
MVSTPKKSAKFANESLKNNVFGIKIPDQRTIVVSRIYNWLAQLKREIKPASCVVIVAETYDGDFQSFFRRIATLLAEAAGVSICVDNLTSHFDLLSKKISKVNQVRKGEVICFDSSLHEEIELSEPNSFFYVADSLQLKTSANKFIEGSISIFDAFDQVSYAMLEGKTVYLDFYQVREKDDLSSGRRSFMEVCAVIQNFYENPNLVTFLKVCSKICSTIQRGGLRKHGAMTADLKYSDLAMRMYLDIPFGDLSHIKKGLSINTLPNLADIELICEKQNKGELFIEKSLGFSTGMHGDVYEELRTNVCRALSLINEDQCLVSPVNLAQCYTRSDVVAGFRQTTQFLIDVFNKQLELNFPLRDRQIGVGICGLANCLKIWGISYPEFIDFLTAWNNKVPNLDVMDTPVAVLVQALDEGVKEAAKIGRMHRMRAIFAIEPNESCARRVTDLWGDDVCPNIDPPDVVPGVGIEERHSGVGVYAYTGEKITTTFSYGKNIFPASYLTEQQHFELWNQMQVLLDSTGLAHGASYEQWHPLTTTTFLQWWNSALKFIYYNRSVGTQHLVKGNGGISAVNARSRVVSGTKSNNQSNQSNQPDQVCTLAAREAGCETCD